MTNPLALPLAVASFGLGVLIAAPARAASLTESRTSGIVVGEALCVLIRHNAPVSIRREEFSRLVHKLVRADVLDVTTHGEAFLEVVDAVVKTCPSRRLPDA